MLSASRLSFITQTETPEDSLSIISAHDPVNFATKSSLSTPGDTTRKHLSVIVLYTYSPVIGVNAEATSPPARQQPCGRPRGGAPASGWRLAPWRCSRGLLGAGMVQPPGTLPLAGGTVALYRQARTYGKPDLPCSRPGASKAACFHKIICTRTRELQGRSPPCAPWYGRAAIW